MNNFCKLYMKEWYGWKKSNMTDFNLWFKGYLLEYSFELLKAELSMKSKKSALKYDDVEEIISHLRGHFAIVIESSEWVYASVDKTRSIPLFYIEDNNDYIISNHAPSLKQQAGIELDDVNTSSKLEIKMSGYTLGNKTLFKSIKAFQPGQSLFCSKNNNTQLKTVNLYKPWNTNNKDYDCLLNELSAITLEILREMINSLDGRQAVIPLSAGNDSRLIASGLRELGYDNVLCFSYGMKNNFEAQVAKKVAQRLGYNWLFVELTIKNEKKFYQSKEFSEYLDFSDAFDSVQYFQGLSSISYLRENNLIDKDCIFINGNSGDFISGGHVTKLYKEDKELSYRSEYVEMEKITLDKHYNLWGYLFTDKNRNIIKNEIKDELAKLKKYVTCSIAPAALYEYMEFYNRQCKYVISGQRCFEYFGYEWRMPLWDERYIHFWSGVDLKWKASQKLYVDMLIKSNFGNVWGLDIPVNKKTLKPDYIRYIRKLSTLPFWLFGKHGRKAWLLFDRAIYTYFYDVTRMMCSTPYKTIVKSYFKNARHHVSFQALRYLKKIDSNIDR